MSVIVVIGAIAVALWAARIVWELRAVIVWCDNGQRPRWKMLRLPIIVLVTCAAVMWAAVMWAAHPQAPPRGWTAFWSNLCGVTVVAAGVLSLTTRGTGGKQVPSTMSIRRNVHLLVFVVWPAGVFGLFLLGRALDRLLATLLILPYTVAIGLLVAAIRCPNCGVPLCWHTYTFLGLRLKMPSAYIGRSCEHCGQELRKKGLGGAA